MKPTNIAQCSFTPEEVEVEIGQSLKTLRIHKNLGQATVAARAGIPV